MSLHRFHVVAVSSWFAFVVVSSIAGLVLGLPVSAAGGLSVMALALVPPLVFLTFFRGGSPESIGQVLYTEEQRSGALAERLDRIARGQ
jgi:hypothetical protein